MLFHGYSLDFLPEYSLKYVKREFYSLNSKAGEAKCPTLQRVYSGEDNRT